MNETNQTNKDSTISINMIINKNSKYRKFQRIYNPYIYICTLIDNCLNKNDQSFGED